ncbi:phosphotransferase [Actinomadura sp. 9N407]|uniref:phosphotransferase n=1 Tax=Actinomadura sp. 9N407 TaxID=3375154 RepID=UPI0037BA3849
MARDFDTEALARWLDGEGIAPGEPVEISQISGGASNEIYEIRRGDGRMVLRKPPKAVPPGRDATMLREYRALKALNGTDVPHPEAIAACDDTGVIGSTFYLMDHVDGWSPMNSGGCGEGRGRQPGHGPLRRHRPADGRERGRTGRDEPAVTRPVTRPVSPR